MDFGVMQALPTVEPVKSLDLGEPTAPYWIVTGAPDIKASVTGSITTGGYMHHIVDIVQSAGLRAADLFWTSICPTASNEFHMARMQALDWDDVRHFGDRLRQHRPRLIIAVGERALNALTGQEGITKWRGSFLPCTIASDVLVLPILDGYIVDVNMALKFVGQIDLKKIAVRLAPDYREPVRNYIIDPTFDQCRDYLQHLIDDAPDFSFDIETPQGVIGCIGFSDAPYQAICIPFLRWDRPDQNCWEPAQEAELWRLIALALAVEGNVKVAQNVQYDQTWLWEEARIHIAGPIHDTMVMHHLLRPDFKKGLGFLTSVYTLDPYYKDEGKVDITAIRKSGLDLTEVTRQYWTYNAKDCDTTLRIHTELLPLLTKHGHDPIFKHLVELHPHIWAMSVRGIAVDQEARLQTTHAIQAEVAQLQQHLEDLVGHPLATNSPLQMKAWLYDELGLTPQTTTRKDPETGARSKTISADEDALKELRKQLQGLVYADGGKKDVERIRNVAAITAVLDIRSRQKYLSTYLECRLSPDGRIRSTFSMAGAETGRFASYAYTYDDTGSNLQNQPKKARKYLIPDPGEVIVNVDLAQAEARVVAYVSGDIGLKALFTSGVDYHTANAMRIWGITDPMRVTPEQRQKAKIGGHGSNYGATEITLALQLGISLSEAKNFRLRYFSAYQQLAQWHERLRSQLLKTRTIVTPMNRKRVFLGRMNDDLFRNGLAFTPQSTIADLMNHAICTALAEQPHHKLLLQCHDSLAFSIPYGEVDDFIAWLRPHVERTITIERGEQFVIPADFEVGWNMKDLVRYLTPSQEGEVRFRLARKETTMEIVAAMSINKDAVAAIQEGVTWRKTNG
jgi:DNA polymerase I-like protein with 3'-5' exonuclease and polymerase domains